MDETKNKTHFRNRIYRRILTGAFVLVPTFVTILIIRWIFKFLSNLLTPIVKQIFTSLHMVEISDRLPYYLDFLLYLVIVLIIFFFIYILGTISELVAGKKLLILWEKLWMKIPLANSIYSAAKQVVDAISYTHKSEFKTVVLIEFPRPGFKALGFLTGYLDSEVGKRYAKVFIPTTPNPTTGFLEIIPEDQIQKTDLKVDDAFKMIISGGIVSPKNLFTAEHK